MLVVAAVPGHDLRVGIWADRVRLQWEQGGQGIYLKHCGRAGLEKVQVEEVDWRWVY